jgi:hypothetical protein
LRRAQDPAHIQLLLGRYDFDAWSGKTVKVLSKLDEFSLISSSPMPSSTKVIFSPLGTSTRNSLQASIPSRLTTTCFLIPGEAILVSAAIFAGTD